MSISNKVSMESTHNVDTQKERLKAGDVVGTFKNEDEGTVANVYVGAKMGTFNAVLSDADANETVGIVIFNDLDSAIAAAQKWTGFK